MRLGWGGVLTMPSVAMAAAVYALCVTSAALHSQGSLGSLVLRSFKEKPDAADTPIFFWPGAEVRRAAKAPATRARDESAPIISQCGG